MTQTSNEISPLTRTYIKANNIIVWKIESASGHEYTTTLFEGKVTSCKRENGETCPGFHHSGTCHHAALALAREDERKEVTTSDVKGTLNRKPAPKTEVAPSGRLVPMR
jgi:hypothetical protein